MSCAFGIIAVPSGRRAVSAVGVVVGMGLLLNDPILEILEIVKILESGLFGLRGCRRKAEARNLAGQETPLIGLAPESFQ
jgi:hypothetical protein